MDIPTLLVAGTGMVTGIGGLWLGNRKDTKAAESTATEVASNVASKATDSALSSLNAALNRQQIDIEDLQKDNEHLKGEVADLKTANRQLKDDNVTLLDEVRACHEDKTRLAHRVEQLEQAGRP